MSQRQPLRHLTADRFRATLGPEAYANLTEATAQAVRDAGYYVVLGKQGVTPDPTTVQEFAKGFDLDPYSARQRLIAPCPRLLRRESNRTEAQRWIAWLQALGLRAFILSEKAFYQFAPLEVLRYERIQSGIVLHFRGGKQERIGEREIICIVQGSVGRRQVREVMSKDIGAGSVYKETLRSSREILIDLHMGELPIIFRLRQDALDFPALFPKAAEGSSLMMERVLREMRMCFPHAPVMADFGKVVDVIGQSRDVLSAGTNFSYRMTGLMGFRKDRDRVVEESEMEAFDLYSLLSRMQLLLA